MTTIATIEAEFKTNADKFSSDINKAQGSLSSFTNSITNFSGKLEAAGRFGNTFMNIMDRMELTEISLANAGGALANAQLRYNEALAQFGEGAPETTIALNNLERAHNGVDKANMRAQNSTVFIGLTMLGQVPIIVNFANTMITKMREVELATLLTTARIKAMVPELLIISAAAGGVWYLWQTQVAAAEEATQSLNLSLSNGLDSTRKKAEDVKKVLEEIANIGKTTEQRRAIRTAEFEATDKGPEATKQYKADMLRITKEEAEYALSIAKTEEEKRTVLTEIQRIQANILSLQSGPARKQSLTDLYLSAQVGLPVAAPLPGGNVDISASSSLKMMREKYGTEAMYDPTRILNMLPSMKMPLEERLRQSMPQNPTWGSDRVAAEIGNRLERIAREPRQVIINATITTKQDPMKVISDIGTALYMGYDSNDVKPTG